jgi:hypothetical protein
MRRLEREARITREKERVKAEGHKKSHVPEFVT